MKRDVIEFQINDSPDSKLMTPRIDCFCFLQKISCSLWDISNFSWSTQSESSAQLYFIWSCFMYFIWQKMNLLDLIHSILYEEQFCSSKKTMDTMSVQRMYVQHIHLKVQEESFCNVLCKTSNSLWVTR